MQCNRCMLMRVIESRHSTAAAAAASWRYLSSSLTQLPMGLLSRQNGAAGAMPDILGVLSADMALLRRAYELLRASSVVLGYRNPVMYCPDNTASCTYMLQ